MEYEGFSTEDAEYAVDNISVNWNEHSFIGRGENVFTYANTSRSGTLSFMMLVDHPSILCYIVRELFEIEVITMGRNEEKKLQKG